MKKTYALPRLDLCEQKHERWIFDYQGSCYSFYPTREVFYHLDPIYPIRPHMSVYNELYEHWNYAHKTILDDLAEE